jgi:acetyl esterase/lipase
MLANKILPKGTILHEVISLGEYWYRIYTNPLPMLAKELKIPFGEDKNQYLLLFLPNRPIKDKAIIYFHGGGWAFGKPEAFRNNAACFVQESYPVILPAYRKVPKFNSNQIREDAFLAIQRGKELFRQHLGKDIDIIVGGMSAGGNLAALAFLDQESLQKYQISAHQLKGLIALGAPLELQHMNKALSLRIYAGKANSKQFQKANPINFLNHPAPGPILCIHGMRDGLVNYESAQIFAEAFQKKQQQRLDFLTLPNTSHIEVASWPMQQIQVKKKILQWLEDL